MKHLLATVALLAALAAVTGFVAYRVSGDKAMQEALSKRDALEWLRRDFNLNDAQFAAIRQLHASYSVVCEEHCRAIQQAVRARSALKAAAAKDPAALAAADRQVQELRLTCETAIAAHVREVAALMNPEEGRRYLALVLPKIVDFDHRAAPDVGLSRHDH
jgi:hypothetical protein